MATLVKSFAIQGIDAFIVDIKNEENEEIALNSSFSS